MRSKEPTEFVRNNQKPLHPRLVSASTALYQTLFARFKRLLESEAMPLWNLNFQAHPWTHIYVFLARQLDRPSACARLQRFGMFLIGHLVITQGEAVWQTKAILRIALRKCSATAAISLPSNLSGSGGIHNSHVDKAAQYGVLISSYLEEPHAERTTNRLHDQSLNFFRPHPQQPF